MGLDFAIASAPGTPPGITTPASAGKVEASPDSVPDWTAMIAQAFQSEQATTCAVPQEAGNLKGDPSDATTSLQEGTEEMQPTIGLFWSLFFNEPVRGVIPQSEGEQHDLEQIGLTEDGELEPDLPPSPERPLGTDEANMTLLPLGGSVWEVIPSVTTPTNQYQSVPLLSKLPPSDPVRDAATPSEGLGPSLPASPKSHKESDKPIVSAVFSLAEVSPTSTRQSDDSALQGPIAQSPRLTDESESGEISSPRPVQLRSEDQGEDGDPESGAESDSQQNHSSRAPQFQTETEFTGPNRVIDSGPMHVSRLMEPRANGAITHRAESSTLSAEIENAMITQREPTGQTPVHLDLRITEADLGISSTGVPSEVRLQLRQRGEDVLMKVQGSGEDLGLRAQTEWTNLTNRLRPEGLEAERVLFAPVQAGVDREVTRPSQIASTPGEGSRANDEGRQPRDQANEQRQQQQRQQHQRAKSVVVQKWTLDQMLS
jgi:hypothetical protein